MKSEHRHQLKTNELAEWIANLPNWAKEHRRVIIYLSVVTVLLIGSAIFHWYYRNVESVRELSNLTKLIGQLPQNRMQILQAQSQGFDNSYMLIRLADSLRAAAQNTKDDTAAAFALIKQAETLRTELHYRFDAVSEQETAAQMDKAQASYAEAFTKAARNPSLMAAAKFGEGLCKEERGSFTEAENIYRHITETDDFNGTTAAAAASLRLETMDDYKQKVLFKTPQKQEPLEPTQPQIELTPSDINLPDTNLTDFNLPGQ